MISIDVKIIKWYICKNEMKNKKVCKIRENIR